MGLGCDEQLEPPADKSPFKPLEPLSVLPEMGPNNPDLLHLSGRRPQASAPTYPSAALAQRILGERSEPPALSELPAEVSFDLDAELVHADNPVLLCSRTAIRKLLQHGSLSMASMSYK